QFGGFELFDTVEPKFDGTHSIAIDYAAKLRTVLESGNDIVVAKNLWSLTDLDGDGRPEIIDGYNQEAWRYTSSGGWKSVPLPSLQSNPASSSGDTQYGWFRVEYVDIDGDGMVDLVQRPINWGEEVVIPLEDDPELAEDYGDGSYSGSPDDTPGSTEYYYLHGLDWEYGVPEKDRDDSFWYRNLGDFNFESAEPLMLPLEDSSRWTAEFDALNHSCSGQIPVHTFGLYDIDPNDADPAQDHEYLEMQGTLGDYNGDGIADVAYSFFRCVTGGSVSHGGSSPIEEPDETSLYSEIYWGTGRGGFVASGLSAGQPNTTPELHPGPTAHGYDAYSWLYRPHHAAIDLNRSGRVELLNPLADDSLGFARWTGLETGFDLWAAIGGGLTQQVGAETTALLGSGSISANEGYGDGDVSLLGSMSPWHEYSATADFDGNGFVDILHFEPTYDSATDEVSSYTVELLLSDRQESHGVVHSVTNRFGGTTDLVWSSSALLGDNDDVHYVREVLGLVQTEQDDPLELRYFRGEHALGRFRGFGLVEVTRNGAASEYGYATSPQLEGSPVTQAVYRSDGTLESALVRVYGSVLVDGLGLAVDNVAPFANPMLRECGYQLGHGTTQSDGSRTQTVTLGDLVEDCFSVGYATPLMTLDEWFALMGFGGPTGDGGAADVVAEGVWGEVGDVSSEIVTSGLPEAASSMPPLVGIPGGPRDDGFMLAEELGSPSSASVSPGSSLATPPTQIHESFPNAGGATKVWETTRDYHYAEDYDGDGITDMLLEVVDDFGLTDAPVGWALPLDDTQYVRDYQPTRDTTAWGFRPISLTHGNGIETYRDTRFGYPAGYTGAFGLVTTVTECGNDGACTDPLVTDYVYDAGPTAGQVAEVWYPDGSHIERSFETSGSCVGRLLDQTDQEGRILVLLHDSLCRAESSSFEGLDTFTAYDDFNRPLWNELREGGYLVGETYSEYSTRRIARYTAVDASTGFRLQEQFLDRHGRPVAMLRCAVSASAGQQCALDDASSIITLSTWGTDGRRFASYGPIGVDSGEIAASYSDWGATGRLVASHASAHAESTSTWRTTTFEYEPGRTSSWDPHGVRQDIEADPLYTDTYTDGHHRGHVQRNGGGRTVSSTTPLGRKTFYTYDDWGRLEESFRQHTEDHYPSHSSGAAHGVYSVQYEYDEMGRVTGEIGADGTRMVWEYDDLGRKTLESFDDGVGGLIDLLAWTYDSYSLSDRRFGRPGILTEVQDLELGTSDYVLVDAQGRVDRATTLAGTAEYQYGLGINPTHSQDVDGVLNEYVYDVHGRLVMRLNPSIGTPSTYVHGVQNQLLAETDPDGVVVYTDYTVSGLPLRRFATHASGDETLFWQGSYNPLGQLETAFSDGVVVAFQYDSRGRLESEEFGDVTADGYGRDLVWTDDDLLVSETLFPVHSGSGTTSYQYDNWGRKSLSTFPDGSSQELLYDVNGQVRFQYDGEEAESEWRYDWRGELEYYKPAGGGALTYSRGISGVERLVEVEDARGHKTREYQDAMGRVNRREFPDGTALELSYVGSQLREEYAYESGGSMQARRTHSYAGGTGRLEATWDWHEPFATGAGVLGSDYLIFYGYSAAGRLQSTGTFSEATDFEYDDVGLQIWEQWDDQAQDLIYGTWTDPGSGTVWSSTQTVKVQTENLATTGVSLSRVEFLYHDSAGRLIEREVETGSTVSGTDTVLTTWSGLDAFSNPTQTDVIRAGGSNQSSWTYDAVGRVTHRTTSTTWGGTTASRDTSWSWYDDGSIKSVTPDSGMGFDYTRVLDSSTGELLLTDVSFDGILAASIVNRDADQRITEMDVDGTTHHFVYDNMGRLEERSMGSGPGFWKGSYSDKGELVQEDIEDQNGQVWTNSYHYTAEGWLDTEVRGGSGETRDYTYDTDGRRLQTRVNGVLSRVTGWSGSKVSSVDGVSIFYDDLDGVETDHLLYDYERDADGRVSAIYDGYTGHALYETLRDELGRPILLEEASTGDRHTSWGLGLGGLPLEVEVDSTGESIHYLAVEGLLVGAMQSDSSGTTHLSVMTDAVGSVLQVGTDTKESQTAFGESPLVSTSDEVRYLFAGLEALPDAPGIQLSQQRVYDEATGRFLSPDPIGLGGGWHRTRYAMGSPTAFSDSSGYFANRANPGWASFLTGIEDGFFSGFDQAHLGMSGLADPNLGSELFGVRDLTGRVDLTDPGFGRLDSGGSALVPNYHGDSQWMSNTWTPRLNSRLSALNQLGQLPDAERPGLLATLKLAFAGTRPGRALRHQFDGADDWLGVPDDLRMWGRAFDETEDGMVRFTDQPLSSEFPGAIALGRSYRSRHRDAVFRQAGQGMNAMDWMGEDIGKRLEHLILANRVTYGNVPGALDELARSTPIGRALQGDFVGAGVSMVTQNPAFAAYHLADKATWAVVTAKQDYEFMNSGVGALAEDGAHNAVDSLITAGEVALVVEGVRVIGKPRAPAAPNGPGLFANKFPTHAVGAPLQTFTARQAGRSSFSRKLNYVVTEGGELRLGRIGKNVGGGHIDLAGGAAVQAAGEVKIVGGKIRMIDNSSGHYLPSGAGAQAAAEAAFQNAGFGTTGTYVGKVWSGSAWVAQ
ncbi:MAG: RHS repeat-associated protein, partial [Cognaticolwellia sp.]